MEQVLVLMSTYNGEKFLVEQLDSIFRQQDVRVDVLVRDDGSTDDTCNILESWKNNLSLHCIKGENVGSANSFLMLLKEAPVRDYYAFSDQDDVWYPDKLKRAVDMIGNQKSPCLYFANVDLTDTDGQLKQQSLPAKLHITKHNALIESFASGCTMVFNNALRKSVCEHLPTEWIHHDRWLFLSAVFMGSVVYDGASVMGYRQHGGNQVGTRTGKEKGNIIKRLLKKGDFSLSDTAALFYRYYRLDLCDDDKQIVQTCASYKRNILSKIKLLFFPSYRLADDRIVRSIYWKIRILLNRL